MAAQVPPAITATIRALVRYVQRNPSGSDTAEGIARWWLDDETVPTGHVISALDWMIENGLLEVVAATDGRWRYRRIATDAQLEGVLASQADSGHAATGHLP